MAIFNPTKDKRVMLGGSGFSYDLAKDRDAARSAAALTRSGHMFLNTGILCHLLHLHEPAWKVLNKARQWLQEAVEIKERPAHDFGRATDASRYLALSTCTWLLDGVQDDDNFQRYVGAASDYLDHLPTSSQHSEAVHHFLGLLDAGRYDLLGRYSASAARSEDLRSEPDRQEELQLFSHIYESRRTSPGLLADDELVTRWLTQNMSDWLGRDNNTRAALWMKVVYWSANPATASPLQSLLMCYQHMPGISPPP